MFFDETKFYINDGNAEDEIYFAISVPKHLVPRVSEDFKHILSKYRVKSLVYHSASVFKESRPREMLMNELVQLIIQIGFIASVINILKVCLFNQRRIS